MNDFDHNNHNNFRFFEYNFRKHRFFSHEDGYPVCPECGELIAAYLPEDEDERDALLSEYADHYRLVHRGSKVWIAQIIPVVILLLITFTIEDRFHRFGPGNKFPVGGPYIEVYHCFIATYFLALKGLDYLMSLIYPKSSLGLGEGGQEFTRYWGIRLILLGIFFVLTLLYLPHYPDVFGRFLTYDSPSEYRIQEYKHFVMVCRLAYYPSFIAFLGYEIYQYRRYSLILYLNGRE